MKLTIEKAIYGGAGLARHEGKAIFVPLTLPGEQVEAHLVREKSGYAEAALDKIIERSAERVPPPCPVYGSCGGCHYQHAAYGEQLKIKSSILRESLERARIADLPEMEPVSAEPFGYRNRIRLHVQRNPFALCYKRMGSNQNLPVEQCPIAAPLLQTAIATLTGIGTTLGLGAWVEEIELFTNERSLLLSIWTRLAQKQAAKELEKMWAALQTALPQTAGIGVFPSTPDRNPGRLLQHAGESSLSYPVVQREYQVSFGSFFQTNRFLLDRFVDLVTGDGKGRTAWDLYAGVGLFSLPLAERFEQLVAVESAESSIKDLRRNLRAAAEGPRNHRIVAAETLSFLRTASSRKEETPDLVVVDPPRTGLGREVTTLLSAVRAPHITYVSCDPATLSRDVKALLESGYHLRRIQMVDMFPNTFHLECILQLTLR